MFEGFTRTEIKTTGARIVTVRGGKGPPGKLGVTSVDFVDGIGVWPGTGAVTSDGTPLVRATVGGRTTWWWPAHQH